MQVAWCSVRPWVTAAVASVGGRSVPVRGHLRACRAPVGSLVGFSGAAVRCVGRVFRFFAFAIWGNLNSDRWAVWAWLYRHRAAGAIRLGRRSRTVQRASSGVTAAFLRSEEEATATATAALSSRGAVASRIFIGQANQDLTSSPAQGAL